jgi:site-specific recombinase XerD
MKATEINSPEFKLLVSGMEQEIKKENKSEAYFNENSAYINECLSYMEWLGITKIAQLNQELINQYIIYLEQERINIRRGGLLSTGSVNKQKNVIRKFWAYLESEGYRVNPIRLKQKRYNKQETFALTHQEIQWLYSVTDSSAIGYRDRCMLALYYGCGLRRSEGIRLTITDIDFGKSRLLVRKTKNGHERYVMLSPKAQQLIEDYVYQARDLYLAEGSGHERLFIGERGKPVHPETLSERIEVLWRRVKERYNAEREVFGLHTLRHTLGTHLYMAGMGIEKIALMLGHRTLESTQIYIHSANKLGHE